MFDILRNPRTRRARRLRAGRGSSSFRQKGGVSRKSAQAFQYGFSKLFRQTPRRGKGHFGSSMDWKFFCFRHARGIGGGLGNGPKKSRIYFQEQKRAFGWGAFASTSGSARVQKKRKGRWCENRHRRESLQGDAATCGRDGFWFRSFGAVFNARNVRRKRAGGPRGAAFGPGSRAGE